MIETAARFVGQFHKCAECQVGQLSKSAMRLELCDFHTGYDWTAHIQEGEWSPTSKRCANYLFKSVPRAPYVVVTYSRKRIHARVRDWAFN